jgi:predicted anti-sigma-YlaC factor YlaD
LAAADEVLMTCLDIKEKIKPFIDDLLAEDEYQDFVSHLEGCGECRGYVAAFGSISNQLLKLGNVDVPPDFASTVLFKLKQPGQQAQRPETARSKRKLLMAFLIAIMAVAVFAGGWYFKKCSLSGTSTKMPLGGKGIVADEKTIDDEEAEQLIVQLEVIADSIGATKNNTTVPPSPRAAPVEQQAGVTNDSDAKSVLIY